MKSPDENPLLREILSDEELSEFRNASLDRALTEVRHARQRRRVARIAALAILPLTMLALVWFKSSSTSVEPRPTSPERGVYAASPSALKNSSEPVPDLASEVTVKRAEARTPSAVETITDEELFALFPNRALALIGSPGRQQLVFLDVPMHN
jgi:hypothetical protein